MRIYVHKEKEGKQDVLLRPSAQEPRGMTLLRGLSPGDVKGKVREALDYYYPSQGPDLATLSF